MNNIKNYFSTPLNQLNKNNLLSENEIEENEGEIYKNSQHFIVIQSCISKTIIENFPISKLVKSPEKQKKQNWKDQFIWL